MCVHIGLSEDAEIRKGLAEALAQKLYGHGAAQADVTVLCAYKPGLSWLEESFAPKAASCGKVRTVEVRYNPYARPGAQEDYREGSPWWEADTYISKPPRWLHQLYPIDDLIAPILGISRDSITFEAYYGNEDITYEAYAYDESGKTLHTDSFLVPIHRQHYFEELPQMGLSASTTGWFHANINGQPVLNERIATDCEQVWEAYQTKTLPAVVEHLLERCQGDPSQLQMPLFGKLELDVGISEPDA